MRDGNRKASTGVMLELWRSPPNGGDPIGCLATTYTFAPSFFDEQCLSRFLEIESEPDREDLAFLLERECRLGSVYAGVLVDHTQAGVEHSLRWDVLPVRIRSGKQHAKLSLLAWSRHIRIIVASANLTVPGYRINHEVAATVDLSPADANLNLLGQAINFLRALLELVPGANEGAPEVKRALAYLLHVERLTESWKKPRRDKIIHQELACTLPLIQPDTSPRSSLDEAVAACRRHGRSPCEAWVASPFFDVDDDSGRMAAELCKRMARGRIRQIRFCVPTASDDTESAVPRLAAPKAIVTTPSKHQGQVTVEILPNVDDDKNPRPWHAKMIALLGDDYTALMIGSSNFTCAGMGTTTFRNAEVNFVTVVKRLAYRREPGQLEAIWPVMQPVDDLDAAEWLGPKSEHDEEEYCTIQPVPAGFVSATFRAGKERAILLRLHPRCLPPEWRIQASGHNDKQLLAHTTWRDNGSPSLVKLEWLPVLPPGRLLVRWKGNEAFIPLNVENAQQLPPPARLDQMSADDMLWVLAAPDTSAAFRAWAHKRKCVEKPQKEFDPDLDSATPIDLNPLRRHNLQETFLHLIRRRARLLAQLRANVQRPVWGRPALEWRLRGAIGVEALAERLIREINDTTNQDDEALLSLGDFLIVLREVDYTPIQGSLCRDTFYAVFNPFVCDIANKVEEQISNQQPIMSPALIDFWEQVLRQCR